MESPQDILEDALASATPQQATRLRNIAHQLHGSHCRLVTITGLGGMGKTRLALQAADHLQFSFVHGIAFVSLAAVKDPTLLEMSIIDGLQIPLTHDVGMELQYEIEAREEVCRRRIAF